ncbi:MAG: 3-oxoacyl-ACP reductase FabG, partial [Chloroflexi bacterium]|nr:3-oxoacyl-ACP reductase FabG [Chloroflexota bacterium]
NKVAIVTGSASGIGRAIAVEFAKEGASVCVADKNLDGAKAVADEIKKTGGKATPIKVDVSKLSDIDNMVATAVKEYGKIDILVNNAGVYIKGTILDLTEQAWDTMMDVMLKGTFFCSQRVVPHMLKQGKGKIINLGSTFGAVGFFDASAYCAAKGGIINLTRQMALDLAPKKINVNALGPGTTDTPLMAPDLAKPDTARLYMERLPIGRVARPQEIAWGAVYLASDEADFVTGHTLFIDGGWLTQ